MDLTLQPNQRSWCGNVQVPPDKSILQRAILLAAFAQGQSCIRAKVCCDDVAQALDIAQRLGARVTVQSSAILIQGTTNHVSGASTHQLCVLDCGESATLMRLLCGLLVARSGAYVLTGRLALCQRPMQRVIKPLQKMGAHIWQDAVFGDIHIRPTQRLRAIHHQVLLPSAQVKSAILLAALGADGETTLHQPVRTRDHTERLLASIGVVVSRSDAMLGVHPKPTWASLHLTVPGDCSAAAFWWVAACLQSAAELTTPAVGLNPTRTGLLRCLRRMGAHIVVRHQRQCHGELISDVTVHASQLQAIEVTAEEVVSMIDELPVLAVACAAAQGVSTIRGAHELRYKESNRLRTMHAALGRLGVAIELLDDGWRIQGGVMIGGEVQAAGDHRVAMALAVASTVAKGPVTIHGAACCAKSDRYFFEQLTRLSGSPPVVVKD